MWESECESVLNFKSIWDKSNVLFIKVLDTIPFELVFEWGRPIPNLTQESIYINLHKVRKNNLIIIN